VYWYNPKKRKIEDIPAPLLDTQALGMLSDHPNSKEFIEEYRRTRTTNDIVEALIITGEVFHWEHLRERPSE
jgi:hypothetical protein